MKLYIDEEGRTTVYEVIEDQVTIGRGAANDVQLRDGRASKQHAVVRRMQGRLKLIDLESRNGTRVNGQFRNQHWMGHGDTLTVGRAVVRFDAEGALAGPPVRTGLPRPGARTGPAGAVAAPAAVPAAPFPAPAPRAAQPIARPLAAPQAPPPASAPQRVGAPAPAAPVLAAPVPAAPVPAGAGPATRRTRRRPGEEMGVDDEGRPVVVRRKGMGTGTIVLLGSLGAALFVVLMVALVAPSEAHNKDVLMQVNRIAASEGDAEAVRHGKAQGRPMEAHWEPLARRLQELEDNLAKGGERAQEEEARQWLAQNVERFTETPRNRPKGALRESDIAERLRDFLQRYPHSTEARFGLQGTRPGEPWETYRRILRENATSGADVGELLAQADRTAGTLRTTRRFGEAVEVYERLKNVQKLLLPAEPYAELRRKADAQITVIQRAAQAAFDEEMATVRELQARGDVLSARARLELIIKDYGLEHLVREARTALEALR